MDEGLQNHRPFGGWLGSDDARRGKLRYASGRSMHSIIRGLRATREIETS